VDSYDLDLDQRLSEETTVLVENYTVSRLLPDYYPRLTHALPSYQTGV